MSPEDDLVDNTALDDILASMSEAGPPDEAAAVSEQGDDAKKEKAVGPDTAESSTSAEDPIEELTEARPEDGVESADAADAAEAPSDSEETETPDKVPIEDMVLEDAEAPAEITPGEGDVPEAAGTEDAAASISVDDALTDAPAEEVELESVENILQEMPAEASDEADLAGEAESAGGDTGDLVESAGEAVGRPELESILTEVEEDDMGRPDQPAGAGQPAGAVEPSLSPSAAGACSLLHAGKLQWVAIAALVVNSAAVAAIAVALLAGRGPENDRFEQLALVLREALASQRAVPETEDTSQVLEEVDKAVALFEAGEYAEALPLLLTSTKALPNRADLLWRAAVSANRLDRWQQSAELFRQFIRRFPDHKSYPDALMHIGDNLRKLGLYADARKWYYRVIGISGRLTDQQQRLVPAAYMQVADCYRLEAASLESARANQ